MSRSQQRTSGERHERTTRAQGPESGPAAPHPGRRDRPADLARPTPRTASLGRRLDVRADPGHGRPAGRWPRRRPGHHGPQAARLHPPRAPHGLRAGHTALGREHRSRSHHTARPLHHPAAWERARRPTVWASDRSMVCGTGASWPHACARPASRAGGARSTLRPCICGTCRRLGGVYGTRFGLSRAHRRRSSASSPER